MLETDISVLIEKGKGFYYEVNCIDYNEICVQHIWLFLLEIINKYLKKIFKKHK